jgi:hypothetical protein
MAPKEPTVDRRTDREIYIAMKHDTKAQLETILGTYDEKLAEVERRNAAVRAAQAEFPDRFINLKTGTIRPVLQEFMDLLGVHGHVASAREQEESSSTSGGITLAAISLRIIPKPFAQKAVEKNNNFVEVTFSANRNERKITVSSTNTIINSGGSRGKRGEYDLESVTAEVIEGHVMQTLQEAFVDPR